MLVIFIFRCIFDIISLIILFFFCGCPVGFTVICCYLGAQGSEATGYSSELAGVTGGPASGEGLQSLLSDDDELEIDELSGGDNENVSLHGTTSKTNSFLLDLDFFFVNQRLGNLG